MSGDSGFYGPISYNIIWTVIGALLLAGAIAIIVVIFYLTRRKTIKTLSNLTPLQPKVIDTNALKQKYIGLINQTEQQFNNRQIKASIAHQHFSKLVRLYFLEAIGFRADVMTLSDLRRTNQKQLAELISQYYPDEFDTLEKGPVAQSAEAARNLVRSQ